MTFTDTFGYAIVLPVLPFAAQRMQLGALVIGGIFATYSFCQLLAAPVLGSLSDRYGRRPLLLVSQAGSIVGFIVLALANSAGWFYLSRLIDGLTAGNIAIIWAAVLDHYPRSEWGRRFANLSTATGIGILLGLIVSSLLARYGLALVAAVAIALTVINMAVTLFAFPAANLVPPRAGWGMGLAGARFMELITRPSNAVTRRVAVAGLLSTIVQSAFLLAFPLFLFRLLHFDASQAAFTLTVLFGLAAAFQILALAPLVRRLGDQGAAIAGFGLVVPGAVTIAMVRTFPLVLVASTVIMWGIVLLNPSLTALLGRANRTLDEGAIMGVNQSIASAGQMLGPLAGYAALALASTAGYGALCAVLAAAGLVMSLQIRVRDDRR
ncbi:MAG TPA: MFS transporter [Candidatus Dormibacteraeota bacterium]|nr:MFS transporter [Candidatus Dormibacteraeota bacterium]